jgi:hypothetical protein
MRVMPSSKRTPSPKSRIKIRRLAVGGRARLPATFRGLGGNGERRYATFEAPGWYTSRLTVPLAFAPGAEELEEGDKYSLGCRIARLDDNRAAVNVDGYPARWMVEPGKLQPED